MRSLAALASIALASACESEAAPPDDGIPDDHPCAEEALPPEESELWLTERLTGNPVPLAMLPPFPAGSGTSVTQGNHGDSTHTGDQAFAWDFEAPVGSVVVAAAPGFVVLVEDDSDQYGEGEEFRELANRIVLDHGGGLFTSYVHLAQGSAVVAAGDEVVAGAPLAATGLSGQLVGPHLHFHVENVWSETLPARFVSAGGSACDRLPATGGPVQTPKGVAETLVGPESPSEMPWDTFAEFAVPEIRGLPARIMRRGELYEVTGRAAPGAAAVLLLVFHADASPGDEPGATIVLDIGDDGTFANEITVPPLPAGNYKWAADASEDGKTFEVSRMVLVSIVE